MTDPKAAREAKRLSLDTESMRESTASYPPEIGEGARWLAGFIRRRCGSSMPMFQGMLSKAGFTTTTDTIAKVLKGAYTDAAGQRCIKDIVFLGIIEKFQRQDKLLDMTCGIPFIESPSFFRMRDYIGARQMNGRICKFGLIAGPTGAQKTATYRHLCRLNNHTTMFHYEVPEKANIGEMTIDLCKLFGKSTHGASTTKKRELRDCIKADTTLIIDNMQRLHRLKDGSDQKAFSFFQRLQDETDCTLIQNITYEFLKTFQSDLHNGYFEQFVGRCGGENKFLLLPPFASREEVLLFASHFKLVDAEQHAPYLEAVAQLAGRIRTLLQNLQDAAATAQDDQKPFTIDYLQQQFTNDKSEPLTLAELKERCVEGRVRV